MPRRRRTPKQVETIVHDEAKRPNIPTAEYRSVMDEDDRSPIEVAYARRNRDLDPQLVWRGKDEQDRADLVVQAPPLYIQEKVHPKVLIDDLQRRSDRDQDAKERATGSYQPDLFSDFNGLPEGADRTDFYAHDANWSNRMILGDSLQVMASLAEREGLRGKGAVHLHRPAVRHQVQLELPVVDDEPRCARRQRRPHHARAGAGQGLPRHVAGRHPLLPVVPPRPPRSRPRPPR